VRQVAARNLPAKWPSEPPIITVPSVTIQVSGVATRTYVTVCDDGGVVQPIALLWRMTLDEPCRATSALSVTAQFAQTHRAGSLYRLVTCGGVNLPPCSSCCKNHQDCPISELLLFNGEDDGTVGAPVVDYTELCVDLTPVQHNVRQAIDYLLTGKLFVMFV